MTRKTIALVLTSLFALNACNDEKRPTIHTDKHNAFTHPNIVHNSKRGDGNARTHRTPAPSPSPTPQPAPNRTPNTHPNNIMVHGNQANRSGGHIHIAPRPSRNPPNATTALW